LAARRLVGSVASAQQAVALPPEEPEVLDVAAAAVAAQDAAEVLRQAAAVPGVEAVRPRAARDAAVVQPQAAGVRDAAVLPPEAPDAAAVQLRAERASPAARPLAVAWVFRRDRVLPSAPSRAARLAHAMECLRTASPSVRSWRAISDEVWS
jgi:hypothetical protein